VREKLTRRRFLQAAAAASAASPLLACAVTRGPRRFFTEAETRTLEALCAQIVPSDQDPGAREAGALNFIERQLFGPYRRFRKTYRDGLAALDQVSRAFWGGDFAALAGPQQREILAAIDEGNLPGGTWDGREAKRFFDLVIHHTMQGFYGGPRHGGNRHAVSWRMLGVPYPPVRGRMQYDLTKSQKQKPS
jgi:gluconate 2-dehydrogenase gamma chain